MSARARTHLLVAPQWIRRHTEAKPTRRGSPLSTCALHRQGRHQPLTNSIIDARRADFVLHHIKRCDAAAPSSSTLHD